MVQILDHFFMQMRKLTYFCFSFVFLTGPTSHFMVCPVDSSMAWLTEVALLGSSDSRLAELSLSEETRTLLELALGSSRGSAGGLWRKMEEYALSKGTLSHICLCG